jgi:hypothetical protein
VKNNTIAFTLDDWHLAVHTNLWSRLATTLGLPLHASRLRRVQR